MTFTMEEYYLVMLVATLVEARTEMADIEGMAVVFGAVLTLVIIHTGRRRYAAYRDAVAHRVALTEPYEHD